MSKKDREAVVKAVASHIIKAIDENDWKGIKDKINPCRTCPARDGPHLIGDDIGTFCIACPLRPVLIALADLELRRRRRKELEEQPEQRP